MTLRYDAPSYTSSLAVRRGWARSAGGSVRSAMVGFALVLSSILLYPQAALAHPGTHHDLERVDAALAVDPNNVGLLVQRAYFYRLESRFEDALTDLDRAERLDAESLEVQANRGVVLSALGRTAEAERALSRFLASGPGSSTTYLERSRIRARANRLDEAVADCRAAVSLEPDPEVILECGRLMETAGSLDEAALLYRRGLEGSGGAVVLRLALIDVETKLGRFQSALACVDEAIRSSTNNAGWYLKRAAILEQSGDLAGASLAREQALADVNRILAKRATAIHLVTRAEVYLAQGRTRDARTDLRLAIEKSPRYARAGELLAQLGDDSVEERIERP